MTCVAGVAFEDKTWIGVDSCAVNAHLELSVRSDPKVFRNGPFLIGFAGSFRAGQLMRFAFSPPQHRRSMRIDRYMGTLFIESVRRLMYQHGVARDRNNVEETEVSLLVGYRGRLFTIEGDYQVGESAQDFDAVGTGAQPALGALYVTPQLPPRKRILGALRAAQAFNAGVRSPFTVLCEVP